MGGTCARVCPTEILCEGVCVRNATGEEPIKIGQLQRYAVDDYMDSGRPHPFKRAESSGRKIAVVGAGPAGLACAHRAAVLGHDVTVFEEMPKSGGLNEYGLAAYKMVDDFAQREVAFLLDVGGITIKNGMALGRNLSLADLQSDFDAVFVGVGLGDVNALRVEGEDKDGVQNAIDFIEEVRQTKRKNELKPGDNVIVIGGGNTAIDAAVQAKRLGAGNVTLAYRRGADQMPATEWEQDLVKINDVNVRYWCKPVSISGSKKVEGVVFEKTILKSGKLTGTGETFEMAADLVLKAIGQVLDENRLSPLTIVNRKIKVDSGFMTSTPGIFAGGDCIESGEDLTVQSVDDGKKAADSIHQYLEAHNG
jgi:glutamate synthase (NADPH/NADH) small chain